MSNSVRVQLVEGPLLSYEPGSITVAHGSGAQILFEGIVRPSEEGAPIEALDYEAYEPMTTRELTQLAERMLSEHGLLAIGVEHSVGRVPIGKISFRLVVDSKHRKEGLQAMDEFINEMKRIVPLWKVAVSVT